MKLYLLLALLVIMPSHAHAASLVGKVIEVSSGDVITISNLNRPVRVKLLGIDAPEMKQPFGDVAKKHLSDLVHDKSVVVEYHGIAADGSLTGRVLLDNADICAQMIRDGVAWFDFRNQDRLSVTDREVYRQSELAARGERRGLWQAENPMAPWEFVRAAAFRRDPVAPVTQIEPKTKSHRPVSELTTLGLRTGNREASSSPSADQPMVRWHRTDRSNWIRLRPAGEKFSGLVPEDGEQTVIPDPDNPSQELPVYFAQSGMSRYAVAWMSLPSLHENDEAATSAILMGFLKGFGQSYQEVGARRGMNVGFSCEPQNEKDVSMNGFTGREYDLGSCTVPAKAKIFTRMKGKHLQAYIAIAFYMEEDRNVARFINSFVIDRK